MKIQIMDLGNIIEVFFKTKKNANCILELEKSLLADDENTILSSMDVTLELFKQIFEKNMLNVTSLKSESEEKYREWLSSRYNDFISHLLTYISHSSKNIQERALEILMKFVVLEAKHPLVKINQDEWYFPKLLFQKIVCEILSDVLEQHDLIMKLKNYTAFEDIRFYTLKTIGNILSEKHQVSDIFLSNCFSLLNACSPTKHSSSYLSEEGISKTFVLKKNLFTKVFTQAWSYFLKYELPLSLLEKVLVVLPNKVMQHVQNPCLLTDFLTDLYNKGGILSLLALNGLFELMLKFNVEYPDFYTKFYSLIDETIVNGKYHPTFFYLANMFLSSTHLPANMVAAFIKKLSRISLRSHSESLVKLLPLIRNLLICHPTLHFLLHRKDPKELENDPFDITASDPIDSKAMESSLWEIKDLGNHYNTRITQKAKMTDELPKLEFDLSEVLDTTIDCIYHKDRKRKFPEPTLNEKPSKIKNIFEFY